MTQTRFFEAESVEKAIEKAEKSFQLTSNQLDIEVLESGGKKLFGFKNTPAKISATKYEEVPEETNWEDVVLDMMENYELPDYKQDLTGPVEELHTKSLIGKAWVKDGTLFYESGSSAKPVIVPGNVGKVFRNGEPVTEKFKINDNDLVAFEAENSIHETFWSLTVDQELQQIKLFVRPGQISIPYLLDLPPAQELHLDYGWKTQKQNQLTVESVLKQLEHMKVHSDTIIEHAISQASQTLEEETLVVAEGKLPVDGKHGELEFNIEIERKHLLYREKADGTLDFRESSYIPSVQDGDVLGKVVPPEEGKDGFSVFGDHLKAREGKSVEVKVGSGLEYDESTKSIISRSFGRPVVKRAGLSAHISILPIHTHNGDLLVKHGNISFIGDVEVTGDVYEGMRVAAEGGIYIHKNVMSAVIHAGNDVVVLKNAINSTISSGKNKRIYHEALRKLSTFNQEFRLMISAMKQLFDSGQIGQVYDGSKGLRPVWRVLADRKFQKFPDRTEAVIAFIDQEEDFLDKTWLEFRDLLKVYISIAQRPERLTMDILQEIFQKALIIQEISESPGESNANISLSYTLNSQIYSSGSIDITGKGAVHSSIYADESVDVQGRLIGGTLYGGEKVVIQTAGTPTGVKTIVETSETGKIYIDEAFADVYLRIGQAGKMITKDQLRLVAQLDDKEEIMISAKI
ncbi:flagellar assembly protein A [Salisediminibacterium beveridgei]|nr:FapA family protein [Salisediminibacterium beveridgei]